MIPLRRSLRLGPARRLGGKRFSAKPIPPGDDLDGALLSTILDANLSERAEREALRDWVRRALSSPKQRGLPANAERDAAVRTSARERESVRRVKHTRESNHGAIHLMTEAIGRPAPSAPRRYLARRATL
jgi:hypothetical protein